MTDHQCPTRRTTKPNGPDQLPYDKQVNALFAAKKNWSK